MGGKFKATEFIHTMEHVQSCLDRLYLCMNLNLPKKPIPRITLAISLSAFGTWYHAGDWN